MLEASDWRDTGTGRIAAGRPWGAVFGVGSVMLAAGAVTGSVVSGPMTGLGAALLLIACAYVGIVGLLFVATRCEVLATGEGVTEAGAAVHNTSSPEVRSCSEANAALAPSALAAAMFAPDPAH